MAPRAHLPLWNAVMATLALANVADAIVPAIRTYTTR
jgi:hypothetical protein